MPLLSQPPDHNICISTARREAAFRISVNSFGVSRRSPPLTQPIQRLP
jgi:hypothetical protein